MATYGSQSPSPLSWSDYKTLLKSPSVPQAAPVAAGLSSNARTNYSVSSDVRATAFLASSSVSRKVKLPSLSVNPQSFSNRFPLFLGGWHNAAETTPRKKIVRTHYE